MVSWGFILNSLTDNRRQDYCQERHKERIGVLKGSLLVGWHLLTRHTYIQVNIRAQCVPDLADP